MSPGDTGEVHEGPSHGDVVPSRCTLDGFARAVENTDGTSLNELDPITTLRVCTVNSLYLITVLNPVRGEVLVQGGKFFQDRTRMHFGGSSFGGSCLKLAWIGVGMRMEFHGEGGWIVTSRVQSIAVVPAPSTHGPF